MSHAGDKNIWRGQRGMANTNYKLLYDYFHYFHYQRLNISVEILRNIPRVVAMGPNS